MFLKVHDLSDLSQEPMVNFHEVEALFKKTGTGAAAGTGKPTGK
jgi:hypothetical protein